MSFRSKSISFFLLIISLAAEQHVVAEPWIPDQGDGTYQNPVIYADYSDPDVVRVGQDFFMTSSSFNCVPALPILHSRDLVNWELIAHAVNRLPQEFDQVQHGNGIWAPSIRFHEGHFWIFVGDPDRGIYMIRSRNARGPWEPMHLVKKGRGLIDPCPLWDEDGRAYLVHAFAKIPQAADEFNANELGLQWQWQGNPREDWASLKERPG